MTSVFASRSRRGLTCEQGGVTAQWGSDGRQRNVTFNSQNFGVSLTAHWDGNAVLFATRKRWKLAPGCTSARTL